MRRFALALGSAAVAVGLVLAPLPAFAVDPPPPPVADVPVVPGQTTRALTGSPIANDTFNDLFKILHLAKTGQTGVPAVPLANVPKPITAPAIIARGAGAGATAVMAGWAIASNGTIALIGVGTGTDFATVYCSQPSWYQGVTRFVSLSLGPDCTGTVIGANTDASGGPPSVTVVGSTYTYYGQTGGIYCYVRSGPLLSSGYSYHWPATGGGWTSTTIGGGSSAAGTCYTAFGSPNGNNTTQNWGPVAGTSGPYFQIRTSPGGTVLGTMSAPVSNPTRIAKCRITWTDGTTTTGTGSSYTETAGVPMSASGMGCEQAYVSKPGRGPALMPDKIEVDSDNGGVITEISEQDVPSFSPDEKKTFETGNGRGLVLEKVVGTMVGSCMTWEADCAGWWAATSNGTVPTVGSDTYRCTYGGASIALAECGVYRHTFDTRTSNPTITNPATGTETPWVTAPAAGSNPGAANSTSPGSSVTPGDACFSSWPPFNLADPITWVMHPVYCATIKAWVPRESVVNGARESIGDSVDETIIGTIGAGLTSLGESFDAGVGCGGLPFHLEGPGWEVNSMLLASCEEPAAGIAATVRTILTIAIIVGGILAFIRYLGAVFGFAAFGRNNSENKSGGPSFD